MDTDEGVTGQCPDDLTEMSVLHYIPGVYDNTLYVPLTVSEPTLDHLIGVWCNLEKTLNNDFHDVASWMGNVPPWQW